jgi:hypothetical protein
MGRCSFVSWRRSCGMARGERDVEWSPVAAGGGGVTMICRSELKRLQGRLHGAVGMTTPRGDDSD